MRRLLVLGVAVALSGCSRDLTVLDGSDAISLQVAAPASLLVHESALLTVAARNAHGAQVTAPSALRFSTSDPGVALVTDQGVVTGERRGTAVIVVESGALRAEVTVRVTARVRIAAEFPDYPCFACGLHALGDRDAWLLAAGDTLRFTARWVDVDGAPIGEDPSATWTSTRPDGISVSSEGLVRGVAPARWTDVIASTSDGSDTVHVSTSSAVAGLPASLRLSHAAVGLGPVVFRPSGSAPVTLAFGESAELTITSGLFYLETEGLPLSYLGYPDWRNLAALVQEGDRLEVYAVAGLCCGANAGSHGSLAAGWARPSSVPSDSVEIRMVQGWTDAGLITAFAGGASNGTILSCYFDPVDVTPYFRFGAGDVDILLESKYGSGGYAERVRQAPPPGASTTYVILQEAGGLPYLLGFSSPSGG